MSSITHRNVHIYYITFKTTLTKKLLLKDWIRLPLISFLHITVCFWMLSPKSLRVSCDLVIRACQLDVILHFGPCYCDNDEFIIYYIFFFIYRFPTEIYVDFLYFIFSYCVILVGGSPWLMCLLGNKVYRCRCIFRAKNIQKYMPPPPSHYKR